LSYRKYLATGCLLAITSLIFSSAVIAAPIKIAFVGDQGTGSNARAVLTLVANEGTDLLMVQGDLGYKQNAASTWNENLTNALGSDFPVLAVVGNHENFEWSLYKGYIQRRIDQNPALECFGNTGVKALCQFGNIEIVQVAPGIAEVAGVDPDDDYEEYIRSSFSSPTHRWRICSWHKNQKDMQAATKGDSTGWAVYDACLDAGAMIAMAHAHSYSRTHLLSNFEQKTIVSKSSDMTLKPGQSFAFVSGLGGRDVVSQEHGGDWFASIYTASQGATHGALFCTFEIATADCYFKAIDGAIPDRFKLKLDSVLNQNDTQRAPPPPSSLPTPTPGYVFSRTDSPEIRWVDLDASGQLSSVRINDSCAEQLGGPTATGDWSTLSEIAPAFDTLESPCITQAAATASNPLTPTADTRDAGYVFSRTDKAEFRWIDRDQNGTWGNIWITESCAEQLGGPTATGDWTALIEIATAFDAIKSPCATSGTAPQTTLNTETPGRFNDVGYVYSRTDKMEYRWIARDNSGVWGSIWINQECANRLGGPKSTGDWFELMDEAPGFDSIPSPCS
jgi:hypothetical protein